MGAYGLEYIETCILITDCFLFCFVSFFFLFFSCFLFDLMLGFLFVISYTCMLSCLYDYVYLFNCHCAVLMYLNASAFFQIYDRISTIEMSFVFLIFISL